MNASGPKVENRATGVLWFLGGCLGLIEAMLVNVVWVEPSAWPWVILASLAAKAFLVGALLWMFFRHPEFLIARQQDAVPLGIIRAALTQNDPELVRSVLLQGGTPPLPAGPSTITPDVEEDADTGPSADQETAADSAELEREAQAIEQEYRKLRGLE